MALAGCINQLPKEAIKKDSVEVSEINWKDIPLKDVRTGENFRISDFKGKPILMESFAVWCPTCTEQQKKTKKLHSKVGDAIIHVSLDTDPNEDEKRVREHVETNGFDWYYAVSPIEFTRALIDEYGVKIVNAQRVPMILICEDQSTRFLRSGIKSPDDLLSEVENGCQFQSKTTDLVIQETPQPSLVEETIVKTEKENQTALAEEGPKTMENQTNKILEEENNTTIEEVSPVQREETATYLGGKIHEKTTMTVKEKNATLEVMIFRCDDDYSVKCFDSSGYTMTEKWEVNRYIVHPEKLQLNVPIDGIPSIDDPKFVTVKEADEWIEDNELVLAIVYKGEKRVYPLQIMQWHEIVNDNIAGDPILITFCPLCGSGIAFERTLNGKEVKFGVSGALYNSNLVMYDKKTKTFWTQIDGLGIIGELSGTKLTQISIDTVVWRDWKKAHPDSEVLSQDTGFYREYGRDSYGSYYENSFVYFPVENEDQRIHPKTVVFGIEVNGVYKAYKEDDLKELKTIEDTVVGVRIKVERDDAGIVKINRLDTGEEIIKERDFWFAWYAFHPFTLIYE